MSEWAYQKCEVCGARIHMNTKCSEEDCNGDPWKIREKAKGKILILEAIKKDYKSKLDEVEKGLLFWREEAK